MNGLEATTNMNIDDWSVQEAIGERVGQEDLVVWARRPNAPIVNKPKRSKHCETPAQPTPAAILEAYNEKDISLEALFVGGNPF
jgi:hypothetical protein